MTDKLTPELLAKLAEPFRPDQVGWKPQVVTDSGNALAVAYVDPRVVAERLDHVVGGDWSFRWEPLGLQGDRIVIKAILTVLGVTREDVGEYEVTDRDQADPWKSAVSDSLKRAAVLFGVGRYLYWLDPVWCAYDRRRRMFIEEPYIDEQGQVRVRRRTGEGSRDQAAPRSSRGGQRADAPRQAAPAAEATPARQVSEAESAGECGVSWGDDFFGWAGRYLEHQGVSNDDPEAVYRWLGEHGEMKAPLSDYEALSDAQAAFIKALPTFARQKTE